MMQITQNHTEKQGVDAHVRWVDHLRSVFEAKSKLIDGGASHRQDHRCQDAIREWNRPERIGIVPGQPDQGH